MSKHKIDIPLLKVICEKPGAPGYEKEIRDFIVEQIKPYVDSLDIDNLGNVIAFKKGKSDEKIMAAAHLDEIGFMVTHIDDNGFLRFHTLGGFDPKTLTAQRVIIHGKKDLIGVMGSKPIHIMSPEERTKSPKTTDYFIDLGMSKKEVEKWIEIGNPITRERELIEMGDCINSKSLDNRVSVFVLLEAFKRLKNPAHDFYAVFTVQEEIGIRGAQVAAIAIQPDFGIAIDTTIAFDVPGAAAHEKVTSLGEGVAVKIMDSATVCDYRMVAFMKETATKHKIKFQPEILTAGGTDTAAIQRFTAGGAIAGALSIPTRHIHQVIEMVHKDDVALAIELLIHLVEDMNDYNWEH